MTEAPVCPVCGNPQVKLVRRSHLFSEETKNPSVLAYRCENGHLFMKGEQSRKEHLDEADPISSP